MKGENGVDVTHFGSVFLPFASPCSPFLMVGFCSILILLLLSALLCIHIFASMSCCPLVVAVVAVVVEKGEAFVEFFGLMIERMELLCVFGFVLEVFFCCCW